MYYVGIDQHKRFSQVAVVDDSGLLVDERKIYHDNFEHVKRLFE